jgi:beta-fructofuranosidase
MKIYRKPTFSDSTGDAIPFYHDGKYHIFSLTPPVGTTIYPARLRTTWSHAVSENLVDWKELETALIPGIGDEPDADGCWTGSVIYGEGKYHAFYTGYNISAKFQQTICHATSEDGIHWDKDKNNPCIVPKTDLFESLDWRDPYVFFNEEDRRYWIVFSARKKTGPITRRGCVILYRSTNLKNWEYYGPIYEPKHTNCPECPELYKLGDNWYLSYSRFSEFVNTIYRISKSPFGPWRTPKHDGIGGRRFYAAKSMMDKNGRRFYFGWAHDRAGQSDKGEWYWGGAFAIPHEVTTNIDGELDVKMPQEIVDTFDTPVQWTFKPMENGCVIYGTNTITVNSIGTLTYGFFEIQETSFLMNCQIKPGDCCDYFGLLLKSDKDAAKCIILAFDMGYQRVSLTNLPMAVDPFWAESCQSILSPKMPGPDGPRVCEKPFEFKNGDVIDVKVVIDHDLIEIFVGEKVAFTYRSYEKAEYEIGFIVQDGNADYYNIKFAK